jgi:hypothetical protein
VNLLAPARAHTSAAIDAPELHFHLGRAGLASQIESVGRQNVPGVAHGLLEIIEVTYPAGQVQPKALGTIQGADQRANPLDNRARHGPNCVGHAGMGGNDQLCV